MEIKILGNQNSILNQYLCELRDVRIQADSMRFRRNLERVGAIFAYEISKELPYTGRETETSLGSLTVPTLAEQPVLGTILRAGVPLHQGMLNVFDKAENTFVAAFRAYERDGSFTIKFQYVATPSLEGKVLILSDPMLATGASMVMSYHELLKYGTPKQVHVVSVLASKEGVEYVRKELGDTNMTLWLGAVDDELTSKSYIVPGLGDAGDLAYGDKI